jgi:hypothetical protein
MEYFSPTNNLNNSLWIINNEKQNLFRKYLRKQLNQIRFESGPEKLCKPLKLKTKNKYTTSRRIK